MLRKRSRLTQADMAFIMGLPDNAIVSRWEQMKRKADSIALLTYHLVFGVPVEPPHVDNARRMAFGISERAGERVSELEGLPAHPRVAHRIAFLRAVIARLSEARV
ncbi:MAG: helix-turn-helix transcriptional regulator [Bacteroidetes bacterium]|nr:helix-turn-helix transcriptional regulator [Bacteroidota bacterium]